MYFELGLMSHSVVESIIMKGIAAVDASILNALGSRTGTSRR